MPLITGVSVFTEFTWLTSYEFPLHTKHNERKQRLKVIEFVLTWKCLCRGWGFSCIFVILDTPDKNCNIFQVISCLIDPLLQMCTMSASHLSTCDMAAYMVNCIYQMQTTLAVYEFTDKHIEMLVAQVSTNFYHLIFIWSMCNLFTSLDIL